MLGIVSILSQIAGAQGAAGEGDGDIGERDEAHLSQRSTKPPINLSIVITFAVSLARQGLQIVSHASALLPFSSALAPFSALAPYYVLTIGGERREHKNENGPLELFGGPFFRSARDADGHGTHTSSTAAGAPVANASFLGIGVGLAWGGALGACLAIYKACWFSLCSDADLLSAFNDAIKDSVDIISISVGPTRLHLYRILVSASAGNSGLPGTASNVAPWMLTVAASSIDQRFDVNVVLGNSKVLKGMSLKPVGLKGSHALVPANAAAAPGVTSANASFCKPNTLNSAVVRRKIVICSIERIGDDRPAKAREVQRAGGIWTILKDA